MGIDYGEYNDSKYVSLPKVGEPDLTISIEEIKRIDDPEYKFNFQEKKEIETKDGKKMIVMESAGWRCQIITADGKLLNISNWGVWYALKKKSVQDGDTIKIAHPERGTWEVTVLKRTMPPPSDDV